MSRAWSLHMPESQPAGALVVMLHGCVQPASEFAAATRMNAAAAARSWAVLWPEQSPAAHELRCWNWYLPEHQARDRGEPAMLADIVSNVSEKHGLTRRFLCGISAGAAMAAVLAATYPELFSAVAFHSGVPFAAASSVASCMEVMKTAASDPTALGRRVHQVMAGRARVMPALVIHGGEDQALHPRNGANLARQWAIANRLARGEPAEVPPAIESIRSEEGRYDATILTYRGAAVEEWRIASLGHAWSGGSSAATYTDPRGPDATAAVLEFFRRATS